MPTNQRNPGIRKLRARLVAAQDQVKDLRRRARRRVGRAPPADLDAGRSAPSCGPRAAAPGMVAVAACPRASLRRAGAADHRGCLAVAALAGDLSLGAEAVPVESVLSAVNCPAGRRRARYS